MISIVSSGSFAKNTLGTGKPNRIESINLLASILVHTYFLCNSGFNNSSSSYILIISRKDKSAPHELMLYKSSSEYICSSSGSAATLISVNFSSVIFLPPIVYRSIRSLTCSFAILSSNN